jgi:hypothetical protein
MRVPSTTSVRRGGVSVMDILNMLLLYRTWVLQGVCQSPVAAVRAIY